MRKALGGVVLVSLGTIAVGCGSSGSSSRGSTVAAATSAPTGSATTAAPASPTAPGAFAARVANVRAVELSWTDASGDEDGFVIERRVPGQAFAEVGRVVADVTSHRDLAPDLGRTYEYRVRAVNAVGFGESTVEAVTTGRGELTEALWHRDSQFPAVSLAVGDFDGDGRPDVATARPTDPDRIYLNDGTGLLLPARAQGNTPSDSISVACADFDGDKRVDLVYGDQSGRGLTFAWNFGQLSFGRDPPVAITPAGPIYDLVPFDANGDGLMDLLVCRDVAVNVLLINEGSHRWRIGSQLGLMPTTSGAAGDVDGDGDQDVVLGATTGITVWRNDGTGRFTQAGAVPMGAITLTHAVALTDLNGDGRLDLVAGLREHATLWAGDGRGGFTPIGAPLGERTVTASVAAADMDGDGDADLITAQALGSPWTLLHRNDGRGSFAPVGPQLPVTLTLQAAELADMDGDGDLDLVATQQLGSTGPSGLAVYHNR